MIHIAQCSTVHPRIDARIRTKELRSLSAAFSNARIALYVQDGLGNETDASGAEIIDTGAREGTRIRRMLKGSWRMYRALRAARADIVHFHDPELIPIGILLRLSGVKVIYDVHENLPDQTLSKTYLPKPLRHGVAFFARCIEAIAGWILSGIVAAGPVISRRFPNKKTITVHNFPLLGEFTFMSRAIPSSDTLNLVYIGGITEVRGIYEMVAAMDKVQTGNAQLQLAGTFSSPELQAKCERQESWGRVQFKGWMIRKDVVQLLSQAHAGLVVLHPTSAYLDSLPVKMFEYMAMRLPIIASDFPYWRKLLKGYDCAIFVNPTDPQAIADAIDWIAQNPQAARAMGERGYQAVQERYNWDTESAVLIDFYKQWIACETLNMNDNS